ncbi:MAG: hypothetical protein PHY28_08035 [Dehalococcoidales bacterium]|nr:hypothetical protein [Dehalococcoidales bacterium]
MTKKSWKGKNSKKRQGIPSIQTQGKVALKPYTAITPPTKITSQKSSAATKTMSDYKYVYTEIKRGGILFVIIILVIVILWLIMR